MRRLGIFALWGITTLTLLIAVAGAAWVVFVGLPFKKAFANVRSMADGVYSVRPLDQLPSVQVGEVLDGWRCRLEETNRVTDACSLMGLKPSVRNWIELFNAPLREFSWMDIQGTHNAGRFGIIKASFLDFSSDHIFYVSQDRTTAVLRNDETGAVCVFQDQTNVVRFAFYSKH